MSRPRSIIIVHIDYRTLSERFYTYQNRLGFVQETCRTRQLHIDEFLSFLEEKGRLEIAEIIPSEIQAFYHYISHRPNKKEGGILSPKTTFQVMKSIEHLFRMLESAGEITTNPTSTLRFTYPKTTPKREILTQEEITQLYEVCESAWERSILSLAYGCGLRVGELDQVNIEDIKLRERILIVPKGKGNKRRVIPLSPGVVQDLSEYYFTEREYLTAGRDYRRNNDAFMLNTRGGRLKEWTCNKQLKKMLSRVNNQKLREKEITMHSLRHSIATHLIEQGIPVEQVRQFLGHSQLETTQVYTHISKEQLKELISDDS